METNNSKKTYLKIIIPIILLFLCIIIVLNFKNNNTVNNIDTSENKLTHTGTIIYNGKKQEVKVTDYQINYFNLSELFPDFNINSLHNLKTTGTLGTIRKTENAYSKGDNTNKLEGNILYIYSSGHTKITENPISDNFSITITECISTDTIDWKNNIKFLPLANTSNILDIPLITFNVEVNNISEDNLTGKITNVYINDSPISSNFILDTTYTIFSKDKSNVKYPASSQALASSGEKNVNKIGLEVELIDMNENQIYKDIVWLYL